MSPTAAVLVTTRRVQQDTLASGICKPETEREQIGRERGPRTAPKVSRYTIVIDLIAVINYGQLLLLLLLLRDASQALASRAGDESARLHSHADGWATRSRDVRHLADRAVGSSRPKFCAKEELMRAAPEQL
uniref:Uncharacterized protein n=1 Tax=Anopheles farauti TaxID=69004 RepID=A0A182Q432_9DIPT